ncbi:nucleotidyl transferase AbiEii/AbiGii toxin family protein [Glycomyces rhizosphaerae]|uniref:Nucleotidyl transferase AbiEii/AbiGii toxin family protein n=1 Tax=Glycomyces rhizosphaerae TaxID=2054422 RepID=A0ABV7Q3R8_9ACTN
MSPNPQHGTPSGDAFLAIQQHSRKHRLDVQEQMTLYSLEGLLARIATSPFREDFVLKGGVLLAAFSLRRPTKDIDLQATRLANDLDEVAERFRVIAAIDVEDGLAFDPASVAARTIRDGDDYNGVRVKLMGRLGRARLSIGVDVNFGDPIWPRPVEVTVPRLVDDGRGPVTMLGYPLPMVIAEKTVTVIQRGTVNTRWRDFADLHTISRSRDIAAGELRAALDVVAEYRGAVLRPLLPELASMPEIAQSRWAAWRRRQAHVASLPEDFADVLGRVAAFVDPVLHEVWSASAGWDAAATKWSQT